MKKLSILLNQAHRYFMLVMFLQSLCFTVNAQIIWQKSLGGSFDDYGQSLQQTTDGGYVVAGWSESNDGDVSGNNGGKDFWVVKLDGSGDLQWQKSFGGSGLDEAYSVQQTTDGGYVVAGLSESNDGDVIGNHGGSDFWIIKLDGSGNLQWQNSLGGGGDEGAHSIRQTTDGGYVVAGYSSFNNGDVSENHGGEDYWIVKLDASGNLQWQNSLGGSYWEQAWSIQQTTDGGYVVAGYTDSNDEDVIGNHGFRDYWVVKLDSSGDLQWQKAFGGSDYEWAYSIQQTTDGGYVVAGKSNSNDGDVSDNNGSSDWWIVKLDAFGELQWQKSLGGSNTDQARSIQQTADGGYVLAGHSTSDNGDVSGNHGGSDYWVVKLDSSGNLIWQQSLGGSDIDHARSIQQTADGGYAMAGYSLSNDGDVSGNQGDIDYWVVKYKPHTVGIPPTSKFERFSLFPNPGSGQVQLSLELKKIEDLKIEIVNALGRVIYSETLQGIREYNRNLDLTGFADGVYLVKVQAGLNTYTERIIVSK